MAFSITQPLLRVTRLFGSGEHESIYGSGQADTFFYENAGPLGTVELVRGGVGILLDPIQHEQLQNLKAVGGEYNSQVQSDGRYLITPKPKVKIPQ